MLGYIISNKKNIKILGHKVFSFDVLCKTNLNIFVVENNKSLYLNNKALYKNNIIYNASKYGHVQVLEWFKKSGYKFKYNKLLINRASKYGNIEILKWFEKSSYKLKYDKRAINGFEDYYFNSSRLKHVKVLEFFKNHNIKKVIKWSKPLKFLKTIKFKTKNNYIKGYNKN